MNIRTACLLTAVIAFPALARETDDPLDTPPSVPAPEKPVAPKPEPAAGSRPPANETPATTRDTAPTAPHNSPTGTPAAAKPAKPGQSPAPVTVKPAAGSVAPKPVDAKPAKPNVPVKPTAATRADTPPHSPAAAATKPIEKKPALNATPPQTAPTLVSPALIPSVATPAPTGASSPDTKGNIVLFAGEAPEQRRQQALLANAERLDRINQELLTRNTALQQQAETAALKARVLEDDRSAEGVRNGALAVIAGFLLGWFFRGLRGGDRRSW